MQVALAFAILDAQIALVASLFVAAFIWLSGTP